MSDTEKNEDKKKMIDEFDKEFEKHFTIAKDKISKFLQNKEADTLIIKGHLLCEYYFNQLLILLSEPNFIEKTWHEKKEKLFQLQILEKDLHLLLNQLNKLRNVLGHELEYVLTESDVDRIGFLFGKGYIIDKYEITNKKKLLEKYISRIVIKVAMVLMIKTLSIKKSLKK